MKILMDTASLPLLDVVRGESIEDSLLMWSIPAKTIELVISSIPQNHILEFNFYNGYIEQLKMVVTSDSIEFALELLINLGSLFPNLSSVDLLVLCSESKRKLLTGNTLDRPFRNFAVKLKRNSAKIDEICSNLNEYIFKNNKKVKFCIEFVYQKHHPICAELVSF
jgi:hypothetical protein